MINGIACFAYFNKIWGIPSGQTLVLRANSLYTDKPNRRKKLEKCQMAGAANL